VLHATTGELVAERAQQQVGVGGGHDVCETMAPTLVLLHGFTNTGASWDPVIAALGGRYRALAPDLRGHGGASDAEPVALDAVVADIAKVAGDGPFALAGYSMGGRIALHIALALRGRVERLVLIGASPGLADPVERAARREADERLADAIETMTIEQFADQWAATPVLAGQPASAHADRLRNTPTGLARALRGLGTGALPSLWDRLDVLPMPVTLVVGEHDVKFRAIARQMASALPDAELVVVPGAGHAVHLEDPESVAAAIATWCGT
jgi:2-succinyl-6-hydroxy-2,4-cyclohexadiene-1-carboxylate synthase